MPLIYRIEHHLTRKHGLTRPVDACQDCYLPITQSEHVVEQPEGELYPSEVGSIEEPIHDIINELPTVPDISLGIGDARILRQFCLLYKWHRTSSRSPLMS